MFKYKPWRSLEMIGEYRNEKRSYLLTTPFLLEVSYVAESLRAASDRA